MSAFPVKCAGCGRIYDSTKHDECPGCSTVAITRRLFWSKADYEHERAIMEGRE